MNEKVRNLAWIGDAVLSLYVREWLSPSIEQTLPDRNALHELFTSNQFLSSFGEPTAVEAEIGRIYLEQGLAAAFVHIRTHFAERFLRHARNLKLRVNSLKTTSEAPGGLAGTA
jgi:23S rRNA maturation mini-RNase III